MDDAVKLVNEARASVQTVRDALRDYGPAALTQSSSFLETAIAALHRLQPMLQDGRQARDAALRSSARELHHDVSQLNALLEASMRFTAGWSCCLSAKVSGYTAQGVPPLLATGHEILIEG